MWWQQLSQHPYQQVVFIYLITAVHYSPIILWIVRAQLPDWADRGMGVSEGIVIAYQQFSMHHWRSKLCLQAFGDQDDITKIIIRFPDLDNVPCSKSSKMSFFQAYVYVWRYEDGGDLAYFSDTILNVVMVKPLNLIEINRWWYCRLSLFIKHPLLIIVMVTQQ